ncbi:Thivi_2564 family membrane protein [Nitrospira sp. Nam74]
MLSLLIMLVIAGAALYLIRLAPIDATVKQIIYVVVVVVLVIWALKLFLGQPGDVPTVHVP